MLQQIDPKKAHKRQQEYVARIEREGFDYGLTVAQAFVESIRDIGYKSTGTAFNELIDNAAEAGAEHVHVCFGYTDGSKKPAMLALMDDGVGMVPQMIRAAVIWGGTDRHNSRDMFGKYGYGLPSASVSQARKFTVYSRPDDGPFHAVEVDLDDIRDGKYIVNNRVVVPEPAEATVPKFVADYAKKEFPGGIEALKSVVVWEKLDRVDYRIADKLENHLVETFGVTYRNVLRSLSIAVNGKPVEPVDPLFLTEGARFYDEDDERAIPEEPIIFDVRERDSKEVLGTVRVRFSLMPPTFGSIDKSKRSSTGKNGNKRFSILKDHNGLIVLRQGRQIDLVTKGAPFTFRNYDYYIGIEADFPASLDEEFGVTTHKQQITLSERMWELLRENGVWATFAQLRKRQDEMIAEMKQKYDGSADEEEKRPSEVAMQESAALDPVAPPSERRSKMAEEGREAAINDLVVMGVPRPDAERVIESVEKDRPFRKELERNPEGPFYRVEPRGGQVVVYINEAHRFFTDIYASVGGAEGARLRQALEVLLFVLGKCELDAAEDRRLFYVSERQEWSKRLHTALTKLDRIIGTEDLDDSDDMAAAGALEADAAALGAGEAAVPA